MLPKLVVDPLTHPDAEVKCSQVKRTDAEVKCSEVKRICKARIIKSRFCKLISQA